MRRQASGSYGPETPMARRLAWMVIGLGIIMIAGAVWIAVADVVGDGMGDWGPALVPLALGLIGLGQLSGGLQILLGQSIPALTTTLPTIRRFVRIGYLVIFVALIVSTLQS